MKKLIVVILVISVICFATSTEKCNPNPNPDSNTPLVNYDPSLPMGWCRAEGYVCGVTTESSGGVHFSLGKDSYCKKSEIQKTFFSWHPIDSVGNLNTSISSNALVLYLEEGPIDNVGAVTLAINTAFIINAQNEKFKVSVTYHQYGNRNDQNSIRLLGIGRTLND